MIKNVYEVQNVTIFSNHPKYTIIFVRSHKTVVYVNTIKVKFESKKQKFW